MNKLLNKIINKPLYVFLGIFLFSFLIRVHMLGMESVNPDAVNWHYRCQQFANGLKFFQFEKTYPHYHPGVTLCYLMSFPTEVYKQLTDQVYDIKTFVSFNILNSYSVVVFNSILIAFLAVLIGGKRGILFAVLLNIEPFFYGNSRIIHLDVIVTLLLFLGVLLLDKFFENQKLVNLYLSAIAFSFAFLTKSVSVVFIVLASLSIILFLKKQRLRFFSQFLVSIGLTIFIFFPAMWSSPLETFGRIFEEADRVGVRTGHNQLFLGEFYDEDSNPGFWFYPLVSLVKNSPLLNVTLVIIFFSLMMSIEIFIRDRGIKLSSLIKYLDENRTMFLLLLFYGFYTLIIFYSSKKVDRYLLVLVPAIIYFLTSKDSKFFQRIFLIFGFVNVTSIIYFFPNLFNYYSPIFLNYQNVNNIIGQKTFGGSIFQLKDYLVGNYGDVSFGFYDIKPIETVYPNSKVFDVRQTSPNKIDIVVLSLNETLPGRYEEYFELKETYFYLDIPMYQIYTKKK